MNKRKKAIDKKNNTINLHKILKNMKILLEISKVIKEWLSLFW